MREGFDAMEGDKRIRIKIKLRVTEDMMFSIFLLFLFVHISAHLSTYPSRLVRRKSNLIENKPVLIPLFLINKFRRVKTEL